MSPTPRPPVKLHDNEIRRALGDPDTPGFVLLTIALYSFGDRVTGDPDMGVEPMDPSEMWAELNTLYGTWVTEEGENKLNAMITGLAGGLFWTDIDVFMAVSTALFDGDLGDMVTTGFEDLNATELMWSILEMALAWDAGETPEFSLDIKQYVDGMLLEEQEDQSHNANEVERAFLRMLEQMEEMGVPASILRALDAEYTGIAENLSDGTL